MKAFGKYQLLDEIGNGETGTVYRACDPLSAGALVVKVLGASAISPETKAGFCRELTACAQLQHPNIVKILDFGEVDGAIYVATELLQGVDLQRHFLECRKLPLARKLRLIAQVYDGLALAHAEHITHGGIRPRNIFLTDHGEAKILDFGVAKLPLEQGVGAHADLFSVAMVLYQLVADVPPFHDPAAEPRRLRKLDPQIPQELERLVASALAKDPLQRPQTAEMMAVSLCAIAEQLYRGQTLPQPSAAVRALSNRIDPPIAPATAPLAASAMAAGGVSGGVSQWIPQAPGAASKPDSAASAAPQPARDAPSKAKPEQLTSEVIRLHPSVSAPAAPIETGPPKTVAVATAAVPAPVVSTAVLPTPVLPKRAAVRRGVVIAAAAALGIFIVAGLLSMQTSNAHSRGKALQSSPASTLPSVKDPPMPTQPSAPPPSPAEVETPKPERTAEQILTSQVDALWESGRYAEAMNLVDGVLAAEPGNAEALARKKKIRTAQEAEAALR